MRGVWQLCRGGLVSRQDRAGAVLRVQDVTVKVRERGGQAWLRGTAETAEANDARIRKQSMTAAEAYRRLLIAAGHLPATEANDRG